MTIWFDKCWLEIARAFAGIGLYSAARRGGRWLAFVCVVCAMARGHEALAVPSTWAGVDMTQLPDLKAPRPDGYTWGMTADGKSTVVRFFVGESPAAAAWWVQRMGVVVAKQAPTPVAISEHDRAIFAAGDTPSDDPSAPPPPRLLFAEELLASGDKLVIARLGNVGLMVERATGAAALAETVAQALVEGPPACPAPVTWRRVDQGWTIAALEEGVVMHHEGGERTPGTANVYAVRPRAVVQYSPMGCAIRQQFDEQGQVVEAPRPWSSVVPASRWSAASSAGDSL